MPRAPRQPRGVSSSTKRRVLAHGPIGWRNWRAQQLGTRSTGSGFEAAFYGDVRFIDELLDLGPYKIFNGVPSAEPAPGLMVLALILRVEEYGRSYIDVAPNMETPTTGSYHGGWLVDEIAALLSLALGVRCQAGEITRRFSTRLDRGVPMQHASGRAWPSVVVERSPILPQAEREVNLDHARTILKSYPALPHEAATALVRAARQYQRALLVAEIDPNLAWLQLVSAIEVAAAYYHQADGSDWETIAAGGPELAGQLRGLRGERRERLVALLAPQVRAAARFRRFLRDFPAPVPKKRPVQYARISWSKSNMSKAVNTIYSHRSTALHDGVPFPSPMCGTPWIDEHGVPAEAMFSSGVGSGDAYWPRKQLPMHLHVFAYIVAHALRGWWKTMASSSARG